MNLTIKTTSAEMQFEMPEEKAQALLRQAFAYSNVRSVEYPQTETAENAEEPAAKPITLPKPANKPRSKLERMFGDYKSRMPKADIPQTQHSEPEFYKGFLLIQCEHCGKREGFCTRSAISKHLCECGKETELHALKVLHLHCKCGKRFRYKTNIADETFEYSCLGCGRPVNLRLNWRGDTYVTVTDREEES